MTHEPQTGFVVLPTSAVGGTVSTSYAPSHCSNALVSFLLSMTYKTARHFAFLLRVCIDEN